MNIYPLNSTQEDMLRESNLETMENGFQVTVFFEISAHRLSAALCSCPSGQTRGRTVND